MSPAFGERDCEAIHSKPSRRVRPSRANEPTMRRDCTALVRQWLTGDGHGILLTPKLQFRIRLTPDAGGGCRLDTGVEWFSLGAALTAAGLSAAEVFDIVHRLNLGQTPEVTDEHRRRVRLIADSKTCRVEVERLDESPPDSPWLQVTVGQSASTSPWREGRRAAVETLVLSAFGRSVSPRLRHADAIGRPVAPPASFVRRWSIARNDSHAGHWRPDSAGANPSPLGDLINDWLTTERLKTGF